MTIASRRWRVLRGLALWGSVLMVSSCVGKYLPPQQMVQSVGGTVSQVNGAVMHASAPYPTKAPPSGTSLDKLGPGLGLPVNSGYGGAAALTSSYIAVGVPWASPPVVHLNSRPLGSMMRIYEFTVPGLKGSDLFGSCLAMDGDTLAVGSIGYGGRGAVFATNGPWGGAASPPHQLLEASDGRNGDWFGCAVALQGDQLAIGAYGVLDKGACYVFRRSAGTWSETAKLAPLSLPQQADFGVSVALSYNRLVVGMPGGQDTTGKTTGAALVYRNTGSTWAIEKLLVSSAPQIDGRFGESVCIEGDRVLVGAPWEDAAKGAVYVFDRTTSGWAFTERLVAPDRESGDKFGSAVKLSVDRAMIGASGTTRIIDEEGAAYVFTRAGPGSPLVHARTHRGETALAKLGKCVDIIGTFALAGAPGHDGSGAVYVFSDVLAKPALLVGKKADDPPPENAYLGFEALPGAPGPASARIQIPRGLWPSFRIELAAGILDEDRAAGIQGATFGMGVEVAGSDPKEECRIDATFTTDGIEATASSGASTSAAVSFADARLLVLAVEHTGTELVLSARPYAEEGFREIGRFAAPAGTTAYHPFAHVGGVTGAAQVGFDDPEVVRNAQVPPGADPAVSAADLVYRAITLQVAAKSEIETGEAAGLPHQRLDDAVASLDEARTKLLSSPVRDKQLRKAARHIKKARKKVASSLKRYLKGKSAKSVGKLIDKASKSEMKALSRL